MAKQGVLVTLSIQVDSAMCLEEAMTCIRVELGDGAKLIKISGVPWKISSI